MTFFSWVGRGLSLIQVLLLIILGPEKSLLRTRAFFNPIWTLSMLPLILDVILTALSYCYCFLYKRLGIAFRTNSDVVSLGAELVA